LAVRFKGRRKRGTVLSTNEMGFIISSGSQGSGASPALSGIGILRRWFLRRWGGQMHPAGSHGKMV
jgi:hypothetical protein